MQRLTQLIAAWPRDDLVLACVAADVPVGPVNRVDTVLQDVHVRAHGMVGSFDHPTIGTFPALSLPFLFDGFDDPLVARPPLLGEHTDIVLSELGYTPSEIASLRESRVI
jgi:crotonobetainyl-CoA:carnitine CoA-transferase CaiB-like acyl-CoA transferase